MAHCNKLPTQKHLTNPDSIWDHKATPQWCISGSFFGRTVFVMTQRNLYPLQRPPCSLGSGIEAPRQAHDMFGQMSVFHCETESCRIPGYLALKFRLVCSSLPKFQETPSQWLTSQSFHQPIDLPSPSATSELPQAAVQQQHPVQVLGLQPPRYWPVPRPPEANPAKHPAQK